MGVAARCAEDQPASTKLQPSRFHFLACVQTRAVRSGQFHPIPGRRRRKRGRGKTRPEAKGGQASRHALEARGDAVQRCSRVTATVLCKKVRAAKMRVGRAKELNVERTSSPSPPPVALGKFVPPDVQTQTPQVCLEAESRAKPRHMLDPGQDAEILGTMTLRRARIQRLGGFRK
jgi:hypothetical protein